ncbi:MAG: YhdP family protein [Paracoccaceae bacterium]
MEKKAPDESAASQTPARPPRQRASRKRRRSGFVPAFSLIVACLVFFVLALALTGRTVPVPEFLRDNLEDRVNRQLDGAAVRLGAMEVGIDRTGVPQLLLNDIRLSDEAGGAVAQLNWLGAELSLERMVRREFAAERIFLTGAQITLRRTADGQFTLSPGAAQPDDAPALADVLAEIDAAMSTGTLASLGEVVAAGIVLTLEDARSGRIWQATNASATLRNTGDSLSLSITSDVFNGTDNLAGLQVSLNRSRATQHVQLGVSVEAMPAADIALQSPVLSWLGVLDAPISGAVRTELDENGELERFAGTLDISEGALKPEATAPAVGFEAAKAYFTFDPDRQRIDFSEISFQSEWASGLAAGHTYLTEFDGAWPGAFVSQFQFEDLAYEGGETFDGALTLDDIRADLRLRLDPFEVQLGQIAVDNDGVPIAATGFVSADETGWQVAVDATTPEITAARVLEFWPRRVSPITRGWVSRNLSEGVLSKTALGLRLTTGAEPEVALSFNFRDGLVRFLPDMPRLTQAKGRAVLNDFRFSLQLDQGEIAASSGETVDASGSSFTVLDTRPKPSWGEIDVAVAGRLDAVLDVLNNRPLRLMERAGRPVEIADADIQGRAKITLPLKDGIEAEEVTYDVAATLSDVTSAVLVPDRVLAARELQLTATPDLVAVSGEAELDGVLLTANWRQPLGDAAENGGQITGQVALSAETVEAFDLPLPDGLLTGAGQADYTLSLPRDPGAPPALALSSDLSGLGLRMDALGWRKSASERGALSLRARLGAVPEIDELRLQTDDLTFDGDLELFENGTLARARLQALELGDWLDADVDILPSGNGGPPTIRVNGGTLDLRRMALGAGGSGRGGNGSPIELQLDRLVVSDNIVLAPVRGRLRQAAGGLKGQFQAAINGRTPIEGVLTPANAGTAIRLTAANAGGVLRDAGLTPNARGGALDLVLTPMPGGQSGSFNGQFLIEDILLRDAPAMAELLDAISVVGLLDQLGGAGIRFDSIDGTFRMNRRQIQLQQAAAVGPSIGISADGIYDMAARRIDIQGVVSPVYFLNGIGSFLTRRGEGLFGFNYRMAGAANDPAVRVNPLSILTPGAFRQIFRRAPPGG